MTFLSYNFSSFSVLASFLCVFLFYHPVRPRQHFRRNRQADLLGGFEIDDEFELRRLLHRQIGGLGALQNLVDVMAARRYRSAVLTP